MIELKSVRYLPLKPGYKSQLEVLFRGFDAKNLVDDLSALKLAVESAVTGAVDSVNSGTGITVDNTDPNNPVINFSGDSDDVSNASGVAGLTVTAALDALAASIASAVQGLSNVLGVSNDAGGLDITNLDDLSAATVQASTSVTAPLMVITADGSITDASGLLAISFDDTGNSLALSSNGSCSIAGSGSSFQANGTSAAIVGATIALQPSGATSWASGTDVDMHLISGDLLLPDWTFDSSANSLIPVSDATMQIGDGTHNLTAVYSATLVEGGSSYETIRFPLTAAQIQTLSSVPLTIVSATAGVAIEVISAFAMYTFVSAAFTSTTLTLYLDTLAGHQGITGTILTSGANTSSEFVKAGGATVASIIGNKDLKIKTNADSAVGDSTAVVYVTYRKTTL